MEMLKSAKYRKSLDNHVKVHLVGGKRQERTVANCFVRVMMVFVGKALRPKQVMNTPQRIIFLRMG